MSETIRIMNREIAIRPLTPATLLATVPLCARMAAEDWTAYVELLVACLDGITCEELAKLLPADTGTLKAIVDAAFAAAMKPLSDLATRGLSLPRQVFLEYTAALARIPLYREMATEMAGRMLQAWGAAAVA